MAFLAKSVGFLKTAKNANVCRFGLSAKGVFDHKKEAGGTKSTKVGGEIRKETPSLLKNLIESINIGLPSFRRNDGSKEANLAGGEAEEEPRDKSVCPCQVNRHTVKDYFVYEVIMPGVMSKDDVSLTLSDNFLFVTTRKVHTLEYRRYYGLVDVLDKGHMVDHHVSNGVLRVCFEEKVINILSFNVFFYSAFIHDGLSFIYNLEEGAEERKAGLKEEGAEEDAVRKAEAEDAVKTIDDEQGKE